MSLVIYFTASFGLLAILNLIVLRIGAAMGPARKPARLPAPPVSRWPPALPPSGVGRC